MVKHMEAKFGVLPNIFIYNALLDAASGDLHAALRVRANILFWLGFGSPSPRPSQLGGSAWPRAVHAQELQPSSAAAL